MQSPRSRRLNVATILIASLVVFVYLVKQHQSPEQHTRHPSRRVRALARPNLRPRGALSVDEHVRCVEALQNITCPICPQVEEENYAPSLVKRRRRQKERVCPECVPLTPSACPPSGRALQGAIEQPTIYLEDKSVDREVLLELVRKVLLFPLSWTVPLGRVRDYCLTLLHCSTCYRMETLRTMDSFERQALQMKSCSS